LPRVMKRYSPTGRRNHGRPLKRLLDTWDRNGSTSGPIPWQIYDDDDAIEEVNERTHQLWAGPVLYHSPYVNINCEVIISIT
jgi:hypothetical protein